MHIDVEFGERGKEIHYSPNGGFVDRIRYIADESSSLTARYASPDALSCAADIAASSSGKESDQQESAVLLQQKLK